MCLFDRFKPPLKTIDGASEVETRDLQLRSVDNPALSYLYCSMIRAEREAVLKARYHITLYLIQ